MMTSCQSEAQGVKRWKFPNKNNRPTEAHLAPFYLAIERMVCPSPLPTFPSPRENPPERERGRECSWRISGAITDDEQSGRLRNDGREIAHVGRGLSTIG